MSLFSCIFRKLLKVFVSHSFISIAGNRLLRNRGKRHLLNPLNRGFLTRGKGINMAEISNKDSQSCEKLLESVIASGFTNLGFILDNETDTSGWTGFTHPFFWGTGFYKVLHSVIPRFMLYLPLKNTEHVSTPKLLQMINKQIDNYFFCDCRLLEDEGENKNERVLRFSGSLPIEASTPTPSSSIMKWWTEAHNLYSTVNKSCLEELKKIQ